MNIFSVMVVLPLTCFFICSFFLEEGLALLRFICKSSGLHQVEKTSWLCYSATKSTKNLEPHEHVIFCSDGGLTPHFFSYFSFCQSSGLHQVEKTS